MTVQTSARLTPVDQLGKDVTAEIQANPPGTIGPKQAELWARLAMAEWEGMPATERASYSGDMQRYTNQRVRELAAPILEGAKSMGAGATAEPSTSAEPIPGKLRLLANEATTNRLAMTVSAQAKPTAFADYAKEKGWLESDQPAIRRAFVDEWARRQRMEPQHATAAVERLTPKMHGEPRMTIAGAKH